MRISRSHYAAIYGPTAGDLLRLGNTTLLAEIERDHATYGDELTVGAGKALRDGEGFQPSATYAAGAPDLVVIGATVIDPVLGILKADIGVRDGRIVGLGKAGNPDLMAGVDPALRCGPNTTVMQAEYAIVTPGGIESHAHFITPDQCIHALAGGTTTMIGMSPGPGFDVTCSGPNTLATLLRGCAAYPLNFGFLGRGSCHDPAAIEESVAGGALGVKIHEDFGAALATVNSALVAADRNDFAVLLHSDTLNEFGSCDDLIALIDGRSLHVYHAEGEGGGSAPDIIRVAGLPNVVCSSTNPTNPFTPAVVEEGLPMTMASHALRYELAEDVAFAELRVRPPTMAAEDLLNDMGAIPIFSSDSQGMGRIAENITNCWQLASVMKERVGRLAEETTERADNERIKRYVAKYTINPAIAFGIDRYVGSLEPGKMADFVIWPRESFGAKPDVVVKQGVAVWAAAGDPAGSIHASEPVCQRPMWGALGGNLGALGAIFVSRLAMDAEVGRRLALAKETLPIASTRALGKADMRHNDACPEIEVDPRTFEVFADGRLLTCEPATRVPLGREYFVS